MGLCIPLIRKSFLVTEFNLKFFQNFLIFFFLTKVTLLSEHSVRNLALFLFNLFFSVSHYEQFRLSSFIYHHLLLVFTPQKIFSFVSCFLLLSCSLFPQCDLLCTPLTFKLPFLHNSSDDFSHYLCSVTHHLAYSVNGQSYFITFMFQGLLIMHFSNMLF